MRLTSIQAYLIARGTASPHGSRHVCKSANRMDHALLDVPRCRDRSRDYVAADPVHSIFAKGLVLGGDYHCAMESGTGRRGRSAAAQIGLGSSC